MLEQTESGTWMASGQKATNSVAIQQALEFAFEHKRPIAAIDQVFHVEQAAKEPGHWYLVGECGVCSTPILLFRDPANGDTGNPFSGAGSFRVLCPICKQERLLPVNDVYVAQND
jgi:hypothetical protein